MARYFTDKAPAVSAKSVAKSEIMRFQSVFFICFALVINDIKCAGNYLALCGNREVMLLLGAAVRWLICVPLPENMFFRKIPFFCPVTVVLVVSSDRIRH